MNFEEIIDHAIAILQRRGRVTYRTLKRQFQLDDDALEDLKEELIYGQRLAVDEDGRVLVWMGEEEPLAVISARIRLGFLDNTSLCSNWWLRLLAFIPAIEYGDRLGRQLL